MSSSVISCKALLSRAFPSWHRLLPCSRVHNCSPWGSWESIWLGCTSVACRNRLTWCVQRSPCRVGEFEGGTVSVMTRKFTQQEVYEFWTKQAQEHELSPSASWTDSPVMTMEIREIAGRLEDGDRVLDAGC